MIDRLTADPSVRERFQFLTFGYDSLQPIPESGRELLEALAEARRRFDPEGRDDSFDRVVLVGHSLGGLVAKAAAARAADLEPAEPPVRRLTDRGGRRGPAWGGSSSSRPPTAALRSTEGVVRSVGAWLARRSAPRSPRGRRGAMSALVARRRASTSSPGTTRSSGTWSGRGPPRESPPTRSSRPSASRPPRGRPTASCPSPAPGSGRPVRGRGPAPHVCFQHPEVIREVRRVLGEHDRRAGPFRAAWRPSRYPPAASRVWPSHESPADASRPIARGSSPSTGRPDTSTEKRRTRRNPWPPLRPNASP